VPGLDSPETAFEPDAAAAEPSKADRRAHNVGLNALARRGMSVAEMRALLEKRELDEETIESELDRLQSSGLLDDTALAENLVRTLHERKRLGRSAIVAELSRHRLDSATIAVAVADLDDEDELSIAIEIATKRAQQLSSYDRDTAQRRLSGYLQRRGYSGSVASAAVREALRGRTDASPSSGRRGPRFE
jgi:regulatory protein